MQIKPVSNNQMPQIFKERALQEKTHERFTREYGGRVFFVFSGKVNDRKVIENLEVVDEIKAEMNRLGATVAE